ncbi:TonB-dependent receptor plug domain-containing protein [Planctomycetota bacterium]
MASKLMSMMIILVLFSMGTPVFAEQQDLLETEELLDMSLEELMDMEVVSSGRRSQPISHAASSIYVITAEDIHAAGITRLADILRFVPGVDVAQDAGYRHALGIRGFARPSSERIEILMDGRPLYDGLRGGVELQYNPLF